MNQEWAPIIDHLVRRGAGAEDEALGEAVPAELGERGVARQACEKERGEDPPRHAGSRTRFRRTGSEPELLVPALLVPNAICRGNGSKAHLPAVPKNDFLSHLFQVPRLAFFFPVIEGTWLHGLSFITERIHPLHVHMESETGACLDLLEEK